MNGTKNYEVLQKRAGALERGASGREGVEETLRKVTHDLTERVKELNCLYAISELLEKPGISLEEILQGTVNIIPPAWQYPESTCARVTLDDQVFKTDNFSESAWKLASDILVNGDYRGSLEVFYKEERPECDQGPFLREEVNLIKGIAEKLGRIIWVKLAEKSLKESEMRYRVLAEQVADGVTLLQEGRFLFANRAFALLFGYGDTGSLSGKALTELLSSVYVQGLERIYQSADSAHPNGKSFRIPCVTREGRQFWVEGYHSTIQFKGKPAVLSTLRDITERVLREMEIQEEADLLRKENIDLRFSMKERYRFANIIGKSQPMQEVYELILKAAHSDANVSVFGESGTGKELVARAIHELSSRKGEEFVTVNCGAIPDNLLESEFFGHKKGAFTSAHMDKVGYLDIADKGSLFLDEIGELSLSMQVKLLRAIDGGDYAPVGSNRTKKSDFRVIAATNSDQIEQVKEGFMREDFFYRINVIPIALPPLRERREDIPLLVDHFLKLYSPGQKPPRVPGEIMDAMYTYPWPGNVRELQNVIRRYLSMGRWDFLNSKQGIQEEQNLEGLKLRNAVEDLEKTAIFKALEQTRWNRSQAAAILGISRRALFRKMKKLELI
jgi:PAS domain S-box-containing protein